MKKKFVIFLLLFLIGCNQETVETPKVCEHINVTLATCTESSVCLDCDEILSEALGHQNLNWETPKKGKCGDEFDLNCICGICNGVVETKKYIVEHTYEDIAILKGHGKECTKCGYREIDTSNYSEFPDNGFSRYGKLKVDGPDIVNEDGEKVQLIGLSTHGLQWFGKYVNYDTIEALRKEFGINTLRLSLYTSENGYCDGSEAQQTLLYNTVVKGIEIATALDMYVVVDWHMVGAEDPLDKNPMTYVYESMTFFYKITEQFKDNENILYEIMNEPNGADVTWDICKEYANKVIPVIRMNTDAIVLVGNPKWTSDLVSVMASPLEGYTNIMYTYHFYADSHTSPSIVAQAYDNGIPVFISEHGGMHSSGNGELNEASTYNWYEVLDERNISYVAWNISNSGGDASIIKHSYSTMTDFSDENLKPWGIFYKNWVRAKFGMDE